ncbi:MAG: hypothetical protein NC419_10055 [Muribaculaceae bacterium]|nr:hypothetical protein [Muribaculaceae bacterium]
MKNKTDIKIMKLNKWYVPKSFSLPEVKAKTVILGCYDAFEIIDVTDEDLSGKFPLENKGDTRHPFTAGYHRLVAAKGEQKQQLVDFSSQEQLLFLNICNDKAGDGVCFTEASVRDFWNKKGVAYPYLFISMIHISHSGMLKEALKKIHKVFQKNYLSYISYDYCDIVLFSNEISIVQFMQNTRKLFEPPKDKKRNEVIVDTFSMISFYPQDTQEAPGLQRQREQYWENDTETFQATINLSIRNHQAFKLWYAEENKNKEMELSHLFGRHDISITKKNANTRWLMEIMDKLHKQENQNIFWTFETFIKVTDDPDIHLSKICEDSVDTTQLEAVHDKVAARLMGEIGKLEQALQKMSGKDKERYLRYILPVYEVRDCICSIVKNGFAEEFVCCIYESFLHFISYMTSKIDALASSSEKDKKKSEEQISEEQISNCYDKYFTALNTLVNSTMHNDRQFVQATAFNAVFYSVPPKILAFYSAYNYRIKQILKEDDDYQYTFLIYPSFSPTIMLEQISLDEKPPCDRILTVMISEKALYDIQSVLHQLIHEQAHYVGNTLRCRDGVRKQKIWHTLVCWVAQECMLDKDTHEALQEFLTRKPIDDEKTSGHDSDSETGDYLQYLSRQGIAFIKELDQLTGFQEFAEEYYREQIKSDADFYDESLETVGIGKENQRAYVMNYTRQYADMKCRTIKRQIQIMSEPTRQDNYKEYLGLIESVYSECYADLQMILILAMGAEDYLNTFLIHQSVSIEDMLDQTQIQDITRISTVFRVMLDSGLWHEPTGKDSKTYNTVFEFIRAYNQTVEEFTASDRIEESRQKVRKVSEAARSFDFNNSICLKEYLSKEQTIELDEGVQKAKACALTDLAADLYDYFLEVMEKSLLEYCTDKKSEQIRQLRMLVNEILNFKDAVQVFNCIESELEHYKKDVCQIYP